MKKRIFVFVIALTLMTATALPVAAAGLLSPALRVLSEQLEMHKCGVEGEVIHFSAEDFDSMLGVTVSAVTVASLPPINEGALLLGNTAVSRNQRIERSDIDRLCFTPHSSKVCESSFRFTYASSQIDYSIPCTVYLLNEENDAPTVSLLNDACFNVTTYRDTAYTGVLHAVDPESDPLTFYTVSYPSHGSLSILNDNGGSYCYQPTKGFTGSDSFTYVACDRYGNRSEIAEVKITVRENANAVNYTDMSGHWASAAAIAMTDLGVMTGTNGAFLPEEEVTRSEFLTMAMMARGYEVRGSKATVFSDNYEIPAEHLGYVAAAYDLGFIHGKDNGTGMYTFCPNEPITRAEAAVILCAVFELNETKLQPVFADNDSIPTWAASSLRTLNAIGALNGTGNGYISASATVTRAQTAQILLHLTMV